MANLSLILVVIYVVTEVSATGPNAFNQACVNAHNRARARHPNTGDVAYDSDLGTAAQVWADHLEDIRNASKHSVNSSSDYGENLYSSSTTLLGALSSAADAVFNWYDELDDPTYNITDPESTKDYKNGHFTQVVWKASDLIGCGRATYTDDDGWIHTIIVAQYQDRGNVKLADPTPPDTTWDRYLDNVLALGTGETRPADSTEFEEEDGCVDKSSYCSMYASYCTGQSWSHIIISYCYKTCYSSTVCADK